MRAAIGLALPASCLDLAGLLEPFSRQPGRAAALFGQFVDAGLDRPCPVPGTDTGR
jgi:hypothetical protein